MSPLRGQDGPTFSAPLPRSRPASFQPHETAHRIAIDGERLACDGPAAERYDLVVVGSGISGLSAARFYRERFGTDSRILLLDAQAHLGGHAKRIEFEVDGRVLVTYGGSEGIISPGRWNSTTVERLFRELGIDLARWDEHFLHDLYPSLGLTRASFFDEAHFGRDVLVKGDPTTWPGDDVPAGRHNGRDLADFVGDFPLPPSARDELVALWTEPRPVLGRLAVADRRPYLARTSYERFLLDDWGLSGDAVRYFAQRTLDWWALPPSRLSALDLQQGGYPGFDGISFPGKALAGFTTEPYIFHFPDGVASIPRLLARELVPSAVHAGTSMQDIVSARVDSAALDDASNEVRLRLESTVVDIRNTPGGVRITYERAGALHPVSARHCVFAAWNVMLPFVMPELDAAQARALADAKKLANAYTKVALRNWRAVVDAGVHDVYCPAAFFSRVKLDYPVDMGAHRFPRLPDEPIVLQLGHTPLPAEPVADPVQALRAGQQRLLDTSEADFEARAVEQLTAMFGPFGFDARLDVADIHVSRWGHAYAPAFNSLIHADESAFDDAAALSRRPVGNVTIANGDSERNGSLQGAIDAAWRAVGELAEP